MSAPAALTLRDLPLPAKVVITCFLLAVGLGYTTAMVQLHFQDSKSGQPMPTPADVVLKFTGKKWSTTPPVAPVSTFVGLITAPESEPFNGVGTMAPAFTTKSDSKFLATQRGAEVDHIRTVAERRGERDVLVQWAKAAPEARKKAYDDDHFGLAVPPTAITAKFMAADTAIMVKSIIEVRCARCHRVQDSDDSNAANYPLETYAQIDKYLAVNPSKPFREGGDWVDSGKPAIGLDKLTQSTHAHLLSFAVLFSLTGLVFAFTSYPCVVRCVVGPWVLIAIVTDVAFWWLARLSDGYGVYFALGVLGTGGAAGLGLGAQITLSVWNMYGRKGKAVVLLIFAVGGLLLGLVGKAVILPGLEEKAAERKKAEEAAAKFTEPKKENPPKVEKVDKKPDDNGDKKPKVEKVEKVGALSQFEKMLKYPVKDAAGKEVAVADIKFKKEADGGMVRAFFDKDGGDFAAAVKAKDNATLAKFLPHREGELAALVAWGKLVDPLRKKAYNDDAFDLPENLKKKPPTPEYLAAGNKVRVKSLIADRCVRCHADDEKAPFEGYEGLLKFLEPPVADKGEKVTDKPAGETGMGTTPKVDPKPEPMFEIAPPPRPVGAKADGVMLAPRTSRRGRHRRRPQSTAGCAALHSGRRA